MVPQTLTTSTRPIWWAIGAATIAALPLAALWTVNRDNRFWVGLVVISALGAFLALNPVADRLAPASVWFGVAYPIAAVFGISMEAAQQDGRLGGGAVLGWAVTLVISILPVIGRARKSLLWFRWWAVWWWVVSGALFFAYGLGLAFVPLAVSATLTARWYRGVLSVTVS